VNTRRTKVVALSTGTHRVPDELRRHQLADDDGNEYSTNLDRNRYGNDDQYLFTVIKFNLDALGLCPLICQVEIIDAKAPKSEECLVVKVPDEGCACHGGANAASAMRVVVGGSGGSRKSLDGSGKLERVSIGHTPGKESKGTPWRVPSTPMSPLKRVASAGDAGGMGVLLDALTQVGGMPPPSPLHLRSPTHNARRASFLSGGAMAAASPSMRPAAAAMSALVNSAPPSAERGAGAGVDVDAAAAAAAHMAQYFSAFGGALGTPAQSQLFAMHQHMQMNDAQQALFQSPAPMNPHAAAAAAAAAMAGGFAPVAAPGAVPPRGGDFDGSAAMENALEIVSAEAATAKANEARASAKLALLEAKVTKLEADAAAAAAVAAGAASVEEIARAAEASGKAMTVAVEARLVSIVEEVAAFGARAIAAETAATAGSAGVDAVAALYVAEAKAHAVSLGKLARLEAQAAARGDAVDGVGVGVETESPTNVGAGVDAGVGAVADAAAVEEKGEEMNAAPSNADTDTEKPASPSAVVAIATEAAAAATSDREKRAREEDDRAFAFEPPPAKRSAKVAGFAVNSAAAAAAAAAGGYAPPTTPALTNQNGARDELLSPPASDPAQALTYAAA